MPRSKSVYSEEIPKDVRDTCNLSDNEIARDKKIPEVTWQQHTDRDVDKGVKNDGG